jgi:hypothetical protein
MQHQVEEMTADQIEQIAREAGRLAYDLQMFLLRLPRDVVNIVEIRVP